MADALAGPAGEARADVADHLELRRLVVKNFGDILADHMQRASTGRTGAARRLVPAFLARQMAGQWPTRWLLLGSGCRWGLALRREGGDLLLDRLKAQCQLIGMMLLRGAAELQPLQCRQKQLQLLQLGIPVGQPRLRRRQLGILPLQHLGQIAHHSLQQDGVVRQAGEVETHASLLAERSPRLQQKKTAESEHWIIPPSASASPPKQPRDASPGLR